MENKIIVNIIDKQTPIVILYGPRASGKTMVMFRLFRYLESRDCHILPDLTFRPSFDVHYNHDCNCFHEMMYNDRMVSHINWILAKVVNNKREGLCQVLKLPGIHCFDESCDFEPPAYFKFISETPNKKVWIIFFEEDWSSSQLRELYSRVVTSLDSKLIKKQDKILLLFSKIDKRRERFKTCGRPDTISFIKVMKSLYPNIFEQYAYKTWIKKVVFGPYRFKPILFTSGVFNRTTDGREVWTPESDWYCKQLWKNIIK